MTRFRLLIAALLVPCATFAQNIDDPGVRVLGRMKSAYLGKWYNTLTFVQRTIVTGASGRPDTTTWYESMVGARLRIDIGSPTAGNGMLYTADSTYIVRNGAVTRTVAAGNPFLPLIMGVYLQPIAQTARELMAFGFDLTKTTTGTWEGKPVTIVGASSNTDTTSAQFWVDARDLVVRVVGAVKGLPNADIRIGGYVPLGAAWLGTRVAMNLGNRTQVEEYSDWRAGEALPPELMDLAKWKTALHWAPKKPQ